MIEFNLNQFRKNKFSENIPRAKADDGDCKNTLGLFSGDISSRDESNLDDQSISNHQI